MLMVGLDIIYPKEVLCIVVKKVLGVKSKEKWYKVGDSISYIET